MKSSHYETLKKIKPTKEEIKKIKETIKQIKKELKNKKITIGGSVGKRTNLKNQSDIDIFVKYPTNEKNIEQKLYEEIKHLKPTTIKASRNYYQITKNGYTIELIPVYDIKNVEEAKNVMDYSPLHTEYVKKKLKNKDEARLLKQFLKANDLYGSETHKQGLSGYATELLTIHYKTFENTIKNISKWKEQTIIDIEKHYKDEEEIKKTLNPQRITPLIIIDPVNPERNAAASLNKTKYEQLKKISKKYLENENEEWFTPKNPLQTIKPRKNETLITKTIKTTKKTEMGRIAKKMRQIKKQLEQQQIKIKKHGLIEKNGEITIYYLIPKKLPPTKTITGPPITMKEHVQKFEKKWKQKTKKKWVEKGRIKILIKRETTDTEKIAKKIIKQLFKPNPST